MVKVSPAFVILQRDLDSGLVKKQETRDGMIEYWVYKRKVSDLISPRGNNYLTNEKELYAIILCPRDHITTKDEEHGGRIFMEGCRFTNDIEGQDLEDYLRKRK